ncbi:uncharacterized protein LOC111932460 [Cyanistes caeruleus]|uniref:uncharacterized protein LOC111932460 n=1 Tax=Cyanistes caeruleus TaxID=156563 RepID=UPI000CDA7DA3|nr:uncharacterized protein LOC111932460 [Cyanistes caeruleus]
MDYLEALLDDSWKVLKNAGAKPLGEGDLASQSTSRTEAQGDGKVMDQKTMQVETFPRGNSGSLAASAAGKKAMPGKGPDTGDAASITTRVPDSQNTTERGFCQGTLCWLGITAGLLCLELVFILCCFGIWYTWKRKRSASAASNVLPNMLGWENYTRLPPSPNQCTLSLPQLPYQLIAVEVQPPCRTGPSAPAGAGPGVLPCLKVGPSCQGRA